MANLSQKELDNQKAKQRGVAKAGAEAGREGEEAAVARRRKTEALRQLRETQENSEERTAMMRAAKKPVRRTSKS